MNLLRGVNNLDDFINIEKLIQWLGAEGARAGLRHSKRLTLNELYKIAEANYVPYKTRTTRNQLIDLMILQFDKRIDKSFDELTSMNSADMSEYLDRTGCSREEIVNLLTINEIPFKKSDSRASLIRHSADQISGLGIFKRIAKNNKDEN
jgi:hypothetical protein